MLEWYQLLSIAAVVFTGLGSIICAILWYIVRSTIANLRIVEGDLANHRLHVSESYAKKDDVEATYQKLIAYLDQMRTTINQIAVDMASNKSHSNK